MHLARDASMSPEHAPAPQTPADAPFQPEPGADATTPFDWETLLRPERPPFGAHALADAFRDRRVLITGAAGSLGRDLSAFVAARQPAALVLLDSHEPSLFALRERLLAAGLATACHFVLADARNPRKIVRVFQAHQPEFVAHLAAYKHVPWAEEDPVEYLEANLDGARVVVEAAVAAGVGRLVYPSTDKAVNPPSLYGATKRICEMYLRETVARSSLSAVVARFVNVLGSQGSVGPTFVRRIAAGQSLTVTDPRMTRYWITPRHATLLLAGAMSLDLPERFAICLPDASPALPVVEIARRIWARLNAGGGEPPLVVTGARPGERLHEELTGAGESLEAGPLPGILRVTGIAAAPLGTPVADGIADLLRAAADDPPPAEIKTRALAWARSLA